MDIDKIFQSKWFKWLILATGLLLLLLFTLRLGIIIGSAKADFACKWGENYHRNFGGPKQGFMDNFLERERGFMDTFGIFGQIIKIDGNKLTINDKDKAEKIILVTDRTTIREFKKEIKISDLKINNFVVVLGEPNELGEIEAKLIRVMPPPLSSMNNLKRIIP